MPLGLLYSLNKCWHGQAELVLAAGLLLYNLHEAFGVPSVALALV